jgi:hypothetical protein
MSLHAWNRCSCWSCSYSIFISLGRLGTVDNGTFQLCVRLFCATTLTCLEGLQRAKLLLHITLPTRRTLCQARSLLASNLPRPTWMLQQAECSGSPAEGHQPLCPLTRSLPLQWVRLVLHAGVHRPLCPLMRPLPLQWLRLVLQARVRQPLYPLMRSLPP